MWGVEGAGETGNKRGEEFIPFLLYRSLEVFTTKLTKHEEQSATFYTSNFAFNFLQYFFCKQTAD